MGRMEGWLWGVVKAAGAACAAYWGDMPVLVQVLIGLMVLDIASGLLSGFVQGKLSSLISYRGMARKAMVLLLVAMGKWLEPAVQIPLAEAVAGFFVVHESLSILENAARVGLPIPSFLRDALAQVPGSEQAAAWRAKSRVFPRDPTSGGNHG